MKFFLLLYLFILAGCTTLDDDTSEQYARIDHLEWELKNKTKDLNHTACIVIYLSCIHEVDNPSNDLKALCRGSFEKCLGCTFSGHPPEVELYFPRGRAIKSDGC